MQTHACLDDDKCWNVNACVLTFCLSTGVPRHRDGVVRPCVRTSLAYCVQYFSTL